MGRAESSIAQPTQLQTQRLSYRQVWPRGGKGVLLPQSLQQPPSTEWRPTPCMVGREHWGPHHPWPNSHRGQRFCAGRGKNERSLLPPGSTLLMKKWCRSNSMPTDSPKSQAWWLFTGRKTSSNNRRLWSSPQGNSLNWKWVWESLRISTFSNRDQHGKQLRGRWSLHESKKLNHRPASLSETTRTRDS